MRVDDYHNLRGDVVFDLSNAEEAELAEWLEAYIDEKNEQVDYHVSEAYILRDAVRALRYCERNNIGPWEE